MDSTRFWQSAAEQADGCWQWLGTLSPDGYGRYHTLDQGTGAAHRIAYQLAVGPIPDGLTIDHTCRNRACVNPDHLEPVTIQVNLARRPKPDQCPHGHDYDERNTHVRANGKRECRKCMAERARRQRAAQRAA